MRVFTLFLAAFFLAAFTVTLSADPNIKEGKWEMTTKSEMTGMPMGIPVQKTVQCISKNDALPKGQEKDGQCTTKEMKTSGDTISYVIVCKTGNGMAERKGQVTYSGNTLKDVSTTTIKQPGEGMMVMKSTTTGRWIGPCK